MWKSPQTHSICFLQHQYMLHILLFPCYQAISQILTILWASTPLCFGSWAFPSSFIHHHISSPPITSQGLAQNYLFPLFSLIPQAVFNSLCIFYCFFFNYKIYHTWLYIRLFALLSASMKLWLLDVWKELLLVICFHRVRRTMLWRQVPSWMSKHKRKCYLFTYWFISTPLTMTDLYRKTAELPSGHFFLTVHIHNP